MPRVLFVDDEQRILKSLRALFDDDYEVLLANGGAEAFALLRQHEIDVVVSDQRMPGVSGVEVLRAARELRPRAIRILLTGYSDLSAIIGSINEGEIFRFVSKPWSNDELRKTLSQAARLAVSETAEAPPEPPEASGILVLDRDAGLHEMITRCFAPRHAVHAAASADECVELLERHPIGVIVSDSVVRGEPVTALLASLKQHHPQLVSVVVTDLGDASQAVQLINHGQVYRFLIKPLREIACKINIESAVRQSQLLARSPAAKLRYAVEPMAQTAAMERGGLLARIRALPAQLWRRG